MTCGVKSAHRKEQGADFALDGPSVPPMELMEHQMKGAPKKE